MSVPIGNDGGYNYFSDGLHRLDGFLRYRAGITDSANMALASLFIALAALLFTVGSFWWIHARRGKLQSFPPQTFAGYLQRDSAAIRLPLSILNTGAVPIVVTDLRLRLEPIEGDELLMHCRTFRRSLTPEADDVDDFAHPWTVPGRTVVSKHLEFASTSDPDSILSGAPVNAVIEGLTDRQTTWTTLLRFPLHVEIMAHIGRYITYSNQEHVWQPNLRSDAAKAHSKLRAEIEARKEAS